MAKDLFHSNVKTALEKDGWIISADPLRLYISDTAYLEIDLAAENMLLAEKGHQKIAIEIKSFLKKSFLSAFHEAIGQYLDYESALQDVEPDRTVYLAVPEDTFKNELFQGRFIQKRLREEQVNLIVFDIDTNEIKLWKNY
ncbi:MAG TPA: XisH family protein [Saprospiraceae bacterium]|nr:XisH family protein [Saprospiraceae bacterium]